MADTGYNWDAAWTEVVAANVLTTGGTTTYTSEVLSLDGKAACEISIDTDYSDHAKATGGLFVYILREIGTGDYEAEVDGPWGFEMPFQQNSFGRRAFILSAAQWNDFKIHLDWDNSTGSSAATSDVDIRYATIPVAS